MAIKIYNVAFGAAAPLAFSGAVYGVKLTHLMGTMGARQGIAAFTIAKSLNSVPKVNEFGNAAGGVIFSRGAKVIESGSRAVIKYAQPKLTNNVAAVCRDGKHINIKGVDVIKLGPGTLTGTDELLLRNGSKIKSIDSYFDLVAHGSPEGFYVSRGDMELFINHRTIANYIKTLDGYKSGMNIRLISCNTGKNHASVAQDLANKLRVNVLAPNEFAHIFPSGRITIGPRDNPYVNSGQWVEFKVGRPSPKL